MSAGEIVKDIGEIYSRLFDHKPFTSSEIHYCLNEFEEKRQDREIENLFSTLQNISEIKDNSTSKCRNIIDVQLPALNAILKNTLKTCESVANRETDPNLQISLDAKRQERKKIWDLFIDDMNHKRTRIDNTFEEKEDELRDFYSDLEQKLHIHK